MIAEYIYEDKNILFVYMSTPCRVYSCLLWVQHLWDGSCFWLDKQQSDILMSARWLVKTCLSVLHGFSFQNIVFMMAVNAQKPSFVTDRVHFDFDLQRGLSLGPVGPCSVHSTQLPLNPVRGIGFRRSGISLGFTIWNCISFCFSELLGGYPPTNSCAPLQSLVI